MRIQSNGIELEVEDSGQRDRPAVLLIMGLGMQLTAWPTLLLQGLDQAGYRVIRFDNRDAGLSTGFEEWGVPNLLWNGLKHRLGWTLRKPYSLQDMARDALGVLDGLQIARAHVVGASMGGMIAQRMAWTAPERVISLVSWMSSSGAPDLPGPQPQVLKAMATPSLKPELEQAILTMQRLLNLIASPAEREDPSVVGERLRQAVQRAYRPTGVLRQTLAVMSDADRYDLLADITRPTLVIHGREDPLLPLPCGEDTARRIPGARLQVIDGMGHDIPPGLLQQLLPSLIQFLHEHA
jgi:pimeloyl-ACP methyl ester carboxylesterase